MTLLCPSAPADAEGAAAFGIMLGAGGSPRVAYLDRPVPVTPELLASAAPASPGEVLRTAAPCAERFCRHYDGSACTLVTRLVDLLPEVVGRPPPCAIRPSCRWWKQKGKAACARCPQIATASASASPAFEAAAAPPA